MILLKIPIQVWYGRVRGLICQVEVKYRSPKELRVMKASQELNSAKLMSALEKQRIKKNGVARCRRQRIVIGRAARGAVPAADVRTSARTCRVIKCQRSYIMMRDHINAAALAELWI